MMIAISCSRNCQQQQQPLHTATTTTITATISQVSLTTTAVPLHGLRLVLQRSLAQSIHVRQRVHRHRMADLSGLLSDYQQIKQGYQISTNNNEKDSGEQECQSHGLLSQSLHAKLKI
jgi:hypothetical protein